MQEMMSKRFLRSTTNRYAEAIFFFSKKALLCGGFTLVSIDRSPSGLDHGGDHRSIIF